MRTIPLLVLGNLLLLTVVLAPPAAATHSCATASFLGPGSTSSGTVGDPTLGHATSRWWWHDGHGIDVYVLTVGARGTHAQVSHASAFLRIWDSTCTILLCDVYADNDQPGVCTFGGPASIEVLYGWSHEFHTDFTIAVVN